MNERFQALRERLERRIVGQSVFIERLLTGLLSGGHLLIEGLPGLAKTTAVQALAEATDLGFRRIQFTPDMIPGDVTGSEILRPDRGEFVFVEGPVFSDIVLADEINRAPPKVQSALLEAMQERTVSIGGETFELPRPFLVLATQNPIEQEGTYRLPEAQVDRFFLKLIVGYPDEAEELEIMERMATTQEVPAVRPVVDLETILRARELVDRVHLDPRLKQYIVHIVRATREPARFGLSELESQIQWGASPRASIMLSLCVRANAFLAHRGFVTPSDVKRVATWILRHRIAPTYEAEAEGRTTDDLVARVLETIPVP